MEEANQKMFDAAGICTFFETKIDFQVFIESIILQFIFSILIFFQFLVLNLKI
ncbi:MAG: hypothetical protein RSC04_01525 [Bacteroidales bacterium]